MYKFFRSLLFQLPPETAHALTLHALRITGVLPPSRWFLQALFNAPSKPVQAFGLTFKNPVGLAAGYDKDGVAIRGLSALGFGHIEVGTVTPRPQAGNPKPRLFRLVEDEAVINRLGFPGKGAQYVSDQLSVFRNRPRPGLSAVEGSTVLGLNLGKNKDSPLDEAANDYIRLMQTFSPLADYLTINISSPNTIGLRRLQGREMLESLLSQIAAARRTSHIARPILVKLAPDLSDDELNDALGVILDTGMDGVIATNTTIAREGLRSRYGKETGGLSGSPLKVQSEAMLKKIVRLVNGRVPIISVGGIMNPADAKHRLEMGATLVQIYTGLIYRGPGFVRAIVKAL